MIYFGQITEGPGVTEGPGEDCIGQTSNYRAEVRLIPPVTLKKIEGKRHLLILDN